VVSAGVKRLKDAGLDRSTAARVVKLAEEAARYG